MTTKPENNNNQKLGFNWPMLIVISTILLVSTASGWAWHYNTNIKTSNTEQLETGTFNVIGCDNFKTEDVNVIIVKANDRRINYFNTPKSCQCDPNANYPKNLIYSHTPSVCKYTNPD